MVNCALRNLVATLIPGGGVSAPSRSTELRHTWQQDNLPTATSHSQRLILRTSSCGGTITATWQLTDGTNQSWNDNANLHGRLYLRVRRCEAGRNF